MPRTAKKPKKQKGKMTGKGTNKGRGATPIQVLSNQFKYMGKTPVPGTRVTITPTPKPQTSIPMPAGYGKLKAGIEQFLALGGWKPKKKKK